MAEPRGELLRFTDSAYRVVKQKPDVTVVIKVTGGTITLNAGKDGPPSEWIVRGGRTAHRLFDYNILKALNAIGYSTMHPVWDLAKTLAPLVNGEIVTPEPVWPTYPKDAIL